MKKIAHKIRKSNNHFVFRNGKKDIEALAEYCNMQTDKINELIATINRLVEKAELQERLEDIP